MFILEWLLLSFILYVGCYISLTIIGVSVDGVSGVRELYKFKKHKTIHMFLFFGSLIPIIVGCIEYFIN